MHPEKAVSTIVVFFLILTSTCFAPLFAQENPQDLSTARRQISQIREEIEQLQRELQVSSNTLQSQIRILQNLDKQVALYQQSLSLLRQEIARSQREIASLSSRIEDLTKQIKTLQEKFSQQIVYIYKYHRGKELDWILGSQNFNQALLRYRFFRTISRSVEFVYERLKKKQQTLQELKDARSRELQQQQQLAVEKAAQQKRFLVKREERQRQIQQITQNRKLLELALIEKQKSLEKLEKVIRELEREREERISDPQANVRWESLPGNFGQQRGKLNWPVRGKVLHAFGKYRNPKLKTVLVNNGIDIKAKKGTPVHCVATGIVSMVTYMSGYGKMIIVDHNRGFYTVYAHLEEVFVSKFERVEAGKVIGTVGDSGSLEGSLLHFEIYGGNKPLNPLRWLKKR